MPCVKDQVSWWNLPLMSLPPASFLCYFLLLQRWVILVSFQSQETTKADAIVRVLTWPSLTGQLPIYSWWCYVLPARSSPKPRVGPHCHWQTTGCMRWWHGGCIGLYMWYKYICKKWVYCLSPPWNIKYKKEGTLLFFYSFCLYQFLNNPWHKMTTQNQKSVPNKQRKQISLHLYESLQ